MNCDFINGLTPEQKAELRKLLDEPTQPTQPKYKVKVEFWKNGSIKNFKEYQDKQLHGKSIGWYESGQKEYETTYHQGELHGKDIGWYENGQKQWEADYHQGKLHGKYFGWNEDGQKTCEEDYEFDKIIKEHKV